MDQSTNKLPERVKEIIEAFDMRPHPEGGFYVETYRSKSFADGKKRNLMTAIYFLILKDNVSRFHRIKSDELWFHHEGAALEVHTLSDAQHAIIKVGGSLHKGEQPQALVPAGTIFGSRCEQGGQYSLVSCVVAPGFDFEDFELFSVDDLLSDFPMHKQIILEMT